MRSTFRALIAFLLILTLSGWQQTAAQGPLGSLGDKIQKEAAKRALSAVLNNELPIRLDAKSVYPAGALPGGPFAPKALELTAQNLFNPLPPGDYAVPVIAFCTQYSVHRPGQGVAYQLGPLQGKNAEAIATLLWRGMFAGKTPEELQALAWGIQSGLTVGRMPRSFQQTIDQLIPDYKRQLSGNFIQRAEDAYQRVASLSPRIPSLDALFAEMGTPGQLALSAKRQQAILLQQNTNDQLAAQTLFAGQNSNSVTPIRAEEGPWTPMVPGVAYVRFKVVQGNLGMNTLELRILPLAPRRVSLPGGGYLLNAAQSRGAASPTNVAAGGITLLGLMGGRLAPQAAATIARVGPIALEGVGTVIAPEVLLGIAAGGIIGYAIGGIAAQALIAVLTPTPPTDRCKDFYDKNLYHYTSPEAAETIRRDGLGWPTSTNEKNPVYLTPDGSMPPLRAQLELNLPVSNPATAIIEIIASCLNRADFVKCGPAEGNLNPNPKLGQMSRSGGGIQILYRNAIPRECMRRVR